MLTSAAVFFIFALTAGAIGVATHSANAAQIMLWICSTSAAIAAGTAIVHFVRGQGAAD